MSLYLVGLAHFVILKKFDFTRQLNRTTTTMWSKRTSDCQAAAWFMIWSLRSVFVSHTKYNLAASYPTNYTFKVLHWSTPRKKISYDLIVLSYYLPKVLISIDLTLLLLLLRGVKKIWIRGIGNFKPNISENPDL